ncbi:MULTISPECIES: hypothetical protein [Pseudoalteromonas]|uniref:DUF6966 domain-containing protein n=1 Tax=Pseudoalteromonas rubra TaxID=43658 RepID=A0A5S3UST6_9GAMM|nr:MULTISPECIES: hypothetical protein [Pseudoalteromonas]MCG7561330.1 hypothetical protein [Pseudoalteromonas sp. McH1-42]MEC4090690.1 hypothetical protein [Pseudoalteromonas rubra]QPB85664.1 hypothetical protein CWC22_021895 [Pseudoalteromonas rubra]
MKNVTLLISEIEKIIELLVSVGETNWVGSFNNFRQKLDSTNAENLETLRSEILRVYGGMGSFSDLVLYEQGQPMIKENQKLDELRTELFRILNDR